MRQAGSGGRGAWLQLIRARVIRSTVPRPLASGYADRDAPAAFPHRNSPDLPAPLGAARAPGSRSKGCAARCGTTSWRTSRSTMCPATRPPGAYAGSPGRRSGRSARRWKLTATTTRSSHRRAAARRAAGSTTDHHRSRSAGPAALGGCNGQRRGGAGQGIPAPAQVEPARQSGDRPQSCRLREIQAILRRPRAAAGLLRRPLRGRAASTSSRRRRRPTSRCTTSRVRATASARDLRAVGGAAGSRRALRGFPRRASPTTAPRSTISTTPCSARATSRRWTCAPRPELRPTSTCRSR